MFTENCDYHGRHIPGPHGECVPLDIMQKGGTMLTQAINVPSGQGGGELKKLIRIEERSHSGVQTNGKQKSCSNYTEQIHSSSKLT